jgi:transcriptional regulator with XRE-family HTH domain
MRHMVTRCKSRANRQRSPRRHPHRVPSKERLVDRGSRTGDRLRRSLGAELREARLAAGLSQGVVAGAARLSSSQVSRIERALLPGVSIEQLARLLAVVGLDLSGRAYPFGLPLRDAPQLGLLGRFQALLHASLPFRREVAVPGEGDLRAWDAVVYGAGEPIALEAETRLRDVQALTRRIALKQRDAGIERVILLVADSRTNRRVLRDAAAAFAAFPISSRSVLEALARGADPGGSGVVVL